MVCVAAGELLLDPFGSERRRDHVRMRVRVAAPGGAAVHENQGEAEPGVTAEVAETVAIDAEQPRHVLGREVRPAVGVVGGVDDQLVGADRVHAVEHAGGALVESAFDAEQRVAIRRHADRPGVACGRPGDLDGIGGLRARTEGALGAGHVLDRAATSPDEVARPLRRDDDPAAEDGIAA